MINEKLLQFIWEHQYYNAASLCTEDGETLLILSPGVYNTNQGPDFREGRIRINQTTWAGNIELHILASDWFKHHHQADPNYGNIILHVVWQNDTKPGKIILPVIPMLELQSRVSNLLLKKYADFRSQVSFIPCEKNLGYLANIAWPLWKETLVKERLLRKSQQVNGLLQETRFHWEESLWWMMARSFGGKLNGENFELLARSIPLKIIGRHKHQVQQLEALLFGQAGLLEEVFSEAYPRLLQKEYLFLKKKYLLEQPRISMQFLRMRPGGFPTIRLAQLAVLLHQSSHLFSTLLHVETITELYQHLAVTANDYWHYHFRFDEQTGFLKKTVGKETIDHIILNAIIPILYAYGNIKHLEQLQGRVINWLSELPAENNQVIRSWKRLHVPIIRAADSQAFIELKSQYCDNRRCLDCSIGQAILRTND